MKVLVSHIKEAYELIEEGRLIEATWHLCKANDLIVWCHEDYKSTDEWNRARLLVVSTRRKLNRALDEASPQDQKQFDRVSTLWMQWKLPSTPAR